ncbi:AEC family transporter [Herbiconiux moechotypicola]|uniref:AEC family transporter n=1 Tax=Herbiconiux moechotypicola TaxID=637393 RepID=A0ABP5Q3S5_9MICO|nr:AEC family transporter [Herbiconiux moechotypicola]MCS5729054.1 AEC family transporter [Herbiconiux moechotypicola]
MLGVLTGFGIIGFVIAVGYLVERLGFLPGDTRLVLNRVAFFVATPALLFSVLAESHPSTVFSGPILVTFITVIISGGLYVAISRIWFKRPVAETTIGTASSAYVNANNIGLPVATYVLGNPQLVAPLLLLQLIVMAPTTLGILDISTRGKASFGAIVSQPLRNPMIIASLAGLLLALFHVQVPPPVMAPFELIGGAAIPMVLMAFGMSLVGQRPLQAGSGRAEIVVASTIKVAVMPIVAFLLARFAFHLPADQVFGVVALAALPTAQNIYNFASRYQRGVILARDTVLITTIGSVPVLVVVAALLA